VRQLLNGVGDGRELVGPERRRNEDDALMLDVGRDELGRERGEVNDVARHDGTPRAGRVPQLTSVVKLSVADLVSADHVQFARAEDVRDLRGKVLVQVERQRVSTTRTNPG
jgi:hypothetical protein